MRKAFEIAFKLWSNRRRGHITGTKKQNAIKKQNRSSDGTELNSLRGGSLRREHLRSFLKQVLQTVDCKFITRNKEERNCTQ